MPVIFFPGQTSHSDSAFIFTVWNFICSAVTLGDDAEQLDRAQFTEMVFEFGMT